MFASNTTIVYSRADTRTYGDAPARELAERELRSLSASAGHVTAGQPLPARPAGILDGLPCQPPAISGAPLPAHP